MARKDKIHGPWENHTKHGSSDDTESSEKQFSVYVHFVVADFYRATLQAGPA